MTKMYRMYRLLLGGHGYIWKKLFLCNHWAISLQYNNIKY